MNVISLQSNQHLNECELTLQSMFPISNCTRSFPIISKVSKPKVLWLITVLRELTKFIGSIEHLRLFQAGYIQMLLKTLFSSYQIEHLTPNTFAFIQDKVFLYIFYICNTASEKRSMLGAKFKMNIVKRLIHLYVYVSCASSFLRLLQSVRLPPH